MTEHQSYVTKGEQAWKDGQRWDAFEQEPWWPHHGDEFLTGWYHQAAKPGPRQGKQVRDTLLG